MESCFLSKPLTFRQIIFSLEKETDSMAVIKMIKSVPLVFANMRGIVLVIAVFIMVQGGSISFLKRIDAKIFSISINLKKAPTPEDVPVIVTFNDNLVDNPQLARDLADFFSRLSKFSSKACALILDKLPASTGTIHRNLIALDKNVQQLPSSVQKDELARHYSHVLALSDSSHTLLSVMAKNNVILGLGNINSTLATANQIEYEGPDNYLIDSLSKRTAYLKMQNLQVASENFFSSVLPVVAPVFPCEKPSVFRPLVYKYNDIFLPDISTLLYARCIRSNDAKWVENQGIRIGYRLYPTSVTGFINPMFMPQNSSMLKTEVIPLENILRKKNLSFLKKRIVIAVQLENPDINAAVFSLQSMLSDFTAHIPAWGMLYKNALMIVFFLYLILILPHLSFSLSVMTTLFVIFAGITVQQGLLLSQNWWIPMAGPIMFLVSGHILMLIRKKTITHFHRATEKADTAFFKLGKLQFEQRQYEQAFESFKQCSVSEDVLNLLFDLANEYERRRQYDNALSVFDYIHENKMNHKNVLVRIKNLKSFKSGRGKRIVEGDHTQGIPDFEPKHTLLGHYIINGEIGRGAMGVVYLGHDIKIDRKVAIKAVNLAQFVDTRLDDMKKKFLKEAKAIGRLNCSGIVTVFDVGEEQDVAYIAMDFVPGESLAAYTDINKLLPIAEVLKITARIAEALGYAHARNVIHCDVKPGNILYNDEENIVKVTDFGIARLTDTTLTQTGTIIGSPSYMSPEQLQGKTLDGKSDIFSLGVMFFHMLSGHYPFPGKSITEIAYKVVGTKHPDIRKFKPDLPMAVVKIINKALQKSPSKRFDSAEKMAKALYEAEFSIKN
jgi:tRNA A-37 threonylcarbamoyl transferase component Bud32